MKIFTPYVAVKAKWPAREILVIGAYSKTCVKLPLSKRPKIGFQDQLSLNAGQKYCRMLPLEHSAILSTFIKLPFVIKILFCLFLVAVLHQFYCIAVKAKWTSL